MKRGFTLMELLAVIAIMGIMGAVTLTGYRQMKRGMEQRSVMQNVNQFIRSAYQRAKIDRQPVAVYFWNETLQEDGQDSTLVVVGKAVAVRRAGRITSKSGNDKLYDEFGDLEARSEESDFEEDSRTTQKGAGLAIYKINGDEGNSPVKSFAYEKTERSTSYTEDLLLGGTADFSKFLYAFILMDGSGSNWQIGDAYGFEFAEIILPHGYLFGKNYSRNTSNPVAVVKPALFFDTVSGSGESTTITVSSLRPDNSGAISAQEVGTTQEPTKDQD